MEDYKEEIRNLFLRYYHVAGAEHKKLQRSTAEILSEVRGVIPAQPISEHDIYEVMKDMGFLQELAIQREKVCIFEGDEDTPPNMRRWK